MKVTGAPLMVSVNASPGRRLRRDWASGPEPYRWKSVSQTGRPLDELEGIVDRKKIR